MIKKKLIYVDEEEEQTNKSLAEVNMLGMLKNEEMIVSLLVQNTFQN